MKNYYKEITSTGGEFEDHPLMKYFNGEPVKVRKQDSIVQKVVAKYKQRSQTGQEKYGVTMDRKDLDLGQWLNHLQEELMDATLYIEKLKSEISTLNNT